MTNYMNEEIRNRDIDAMIQLLEEARNDEIKLYELKGYLKGTLNAREKERNNVYKELK